MNYLVKTEINGIQDFIFNIKSKGAAKALKARSFFIDGISQLIAHTITDTFKGSRIIFSGGGNVYAKIPQAEWNDAEWVSIKKTTQDALQPLHLYCVFSSYEWKAGSYAEAMIELNKNLQKQKLQFGTDQPDFFAPFDASVNEQTPFIDFSSAYSKSNAYTIYPADNSNRKLLTDDSIQLGNFSLRLQKDNGTPLIPLPVWTDELLAKYKNIEPGEKRDEEEQDIPGKGNIISFKWLAYFAKERTGTGKLAVLKLDIDNLGKIFQQLDTEEANNKLSEALTGFFTNGFIKILNETFGHTKRTMRNGAAAKKTVEATLDNKRTRLDKYVTENEQHVFKHNIYTVYAGGDDCFVIGAWDAVVNFAIALQTKFDAFQADFVKKQQLLSRPITLSAAILLIDQHFPVVRFAELAEDALDNAKRGNYNAALTDAAGLPMKSCISFMGHVFNWQTFTELISVKSTFNEMVLAWNAPRAFLQRIILSFESEDNFYWHNCSPKKPFHPALLWRFMYSFRDIRHEPFFQAMYYNTFFGDEGYEQLYVWNNFNENKTLSLVLPVAARWTELLTKN